MPGLASPNVCWKFLKRITHNRSPLSILHCAHGEPGPALSPRDVAHASAHLWLISAFSTWIYRCVESVHFHDDSTVRRSVSFDFRIDGFSDEDIAGLASKMALPLTLLEKAPLVDFDLKDASDRPIPLLTKRENTDLTTNAVLLAAEDALGHLLGPVDAKTDPYQVLRGEIRTIVGAKPSKGDEVLDRWMAADPARGPLELARSKLYESQWFLTLCELLQYQFVMFVDYQALDGERHILKMAYDADLGRYSHEQSKWARLASKPETLGWKFRYFEFKAPQVALCESFHIEIHAPEDLTIERASLVIPEGDTVDDDQVVLSEQKGDIAHIYTSNVSTDATDSEVKIFMRASEFGLPRAAFTLSAGVFLLLGIFTLLQFCGKNLVGDHQSAATLLLLAPSIFAAFAIRPGEHRLASKLMFGIRSLVVALVAISVSGSILMMVSVPGEFGRRDEIPYGTWIWIALYVIAGVITFILAAPAWAHLTEDNAESDSRNRRRLHDKNAKRCAR